MLLKLAALGAIAYVGYRSMQKAGERPDIRLAGGPLSSHATLQHSADQPPAANPYPG